jgi:hypothetical protein
MPSKALEAGEKRYHGTEQFILVESLIPARTTDLVQSGK